MADIDQELAARIKNATDQAESGHGRREIAQALGLNDSSVSRMLNGQRKISASELVTIANVLEVPLLSLVQPEKPRLMKMAARIMADPKQGLESEYQKAARQLEIREELSRFMVEPGAFRVEVARPSGDEGWQSGRDLAVAARAALGLHDEPVADLEKLVETRFDIDLMVAPLADDLSGFLFWEGTADGDVLMMVNSNDHYARQRLTIAHELGHFLFGHGSDGIVWQDYASEKNGKETAANSFAVRFLLPEDAAKRRAREVQSNNPGLSSEILAELIVGTLGGEYGLSVQALTYYLMNLKVLQDEQASHVLHLSRRSQVYERAGFDTLWRDWQSMKGRTQPPSRNASMALDAYAEGLIGITTVAEIYGEDDLAAFALTLEEAGFKPEF